VGKEKEKLKNRKGRGGDTTQLTKIHEQHDNRDRVLSRSLHH